MTNWKINASHYAELSKQVYKDNAGSPGHGWEIVINSDDFPDDTFNKSFYACLYKREIINLKKHKYHPIEG